MRNITTLLLTLMVAVILVAGYFIFVEREVTSTQPNAQEEAVETELPGTRTVQLFYYDPERDQDEAGNIMCSRDGLVAVHRSIASMTPIEDTVQLLLAGELTPTERAAGITTEYPLPGVSLSSVALSSDGVLRIALNDPENKLVGGSCRTAILAGQIIETVRQFPEVTSVEFLPEELFQP